LAQAFGYTKTNISHLIKALS